MRKYMVFVTLTVCITILSGCGKRGSGSMEAESRVQIAESQVQTSELEAGKTELGKAGSDESESEELMFEESGIQESKPEDPAIVEVDWSGYFDRLTGTAVLYDTGKKQYRIYNPELAEERHSPCSTFKIVSALAGLENGTVTPDNSTRIWSGERFWNEDWNRDIDFPEAFRVSCVWYFRQLIDDIGKEAMAEELERLEYGNQDISDWEGWLNTNNHNRALTGFWIESSLKISPVEQVQVMERIFGVNSLYSPGTVEQLKQVMKVTDYETSILVYGKTGMGKAEGKTVDAWFTGFAQTEEGPVYFCVRLGESEGDEPTSGKAKEIAVRILSDEY